MEVEHLFLQEYFEKTLGKPVSLTITDNSTRMLSANTKSGVVSIRLHGMFLKAGREVVNEIADFIKIRKGKTPHLRRFIKDNSHLLKKKPPKKVSIKASGKHHNLLDTYNSLNAEYFTEKITSSISWGARSNRRVVKKRNLGSYNRDTDMIRINPVLDKKSVPHYFIEFVVYHEMLHADIHIRRGENGRRSIHSKEFKQREKLFKHYDRAKEWEKRMRI